MASKELDELVKRAESLAVDEQLVLIAHLAAKVRKIYHVPGPRRQWREICGSASCPMLGEDAQAWVSRTRRDASSSCVEH